MNSLNLRRDAATILFKLCIPLCVVFFLSCTRTPDTDRSSEAEQSLSRAPQQAENGAQPSNQSQQLLQAQLEQALNAYRDHDYERAFSLLKPLAEAGQSEAQRRLGVMYRHGLGVRRDDGEAVKWYLAAAEQGHVRAQNNLGIMYLFGLGTAPDSQKAERWLLAAAKQNDAKAQENLGIFYTKRKRYDEAIRYLSLAAQQSQTRAQLNLGLLLLAGNGVKKDETAAMGWISKAAHGGSGAAALAMSKAFRGGLYGYPVDQAQADFWADRAAQR
jgi:uncharacterized protein